VRYYVDRWRLNVRVVSGSEAMPGAVLGTQADLYDIRPELLRDVPHGTKLLHRFPNGAELRASPSVGKL
jgi:hypothetical protein